MEILEQIKNSILTALNQLGENLVDVGQKVIGAIFVLLVGWIITKILVFILKRVLKLAKVDRLTDMINEKDFFGKTDLKFNVTSVIVGFVKWIMFLVFLIVAADIMQWNIVSIEIGNLLRYLPKLFSALALFMIGLYIANFIKKAIKGVFDSFDLSGAKIISALVFYGIVVIVTITSLNQAGINTDIITNNLTLILGAFLAAITIAFGLGSKEVIGDLLRAFYTRKNYEIGQEIAFKDVKGIVESVNNVTMVIKTETGKMVLPIRDVVENQVEIKTK